MPDLYGPGWHMHVGGDYKPGDMPPTGYLDWHKWAEVQHNAGLKQTTCPQCGKWNYPQELNDEVLASRPFDSAGVVHEQRKRICKVCVAKPPTARTRS
jgi:hypothetical protein